MNVNSGESQFLKNPESRLNRIQRWRIFIQERFALPEHLLLIAVISQGNAMVAIGVFETSPDPALNALIFMLSVCFYFRLRCFDEIKDYRSDCIFNPHRPLPRNLLTVQQVKAMITGLTLFELIVVSSIGLSEMFSYGIAVGYSFLMYREFFIGRWLSSKLTAYAISHTFVSLLLAYAVFSITGSVSWFELPDSLRLFGLASWALFNVYEFSRKTFSELEERPRVPTYSNSFGISGAVMLTLSQGLFAVLLLVILSPIDPLNLLTFTIHPIPTFCYGLIQAEVLSLLSIACIGAYLIYSRHSAAAKLFRQCCGLYLISFYALLLGFSFSTF